MFITIICNNHNNCKPLNVIDKEVQSVKASSKMSYFYLLHFCAAIAPSLEYKKRKPESKRNCENNNSNKKYLHNNKN